MTDLLVKSPVVSGLLVQATAVGLGSTSLGWRWPFVALHALIILAGAVAALLR